VNPSCNRKSRNGNPPPTAGRARLLSQCKVRVLSIPAIRDRVVQGALKLILEPIFEADFQPGSFGYRPKRTAHDAVDRVARAIVQQKTRIIDIDLRSYFDNVRHDRLLAKVARRVDDVDVLFVVACGVRNTHPSSRNERRCCGSSRTYSAATNRNLWIGSSS
jgi:retron-type reverse transcriptase